MQNKLIFYGLLYGTESIEKDVPCLVFIIVIIYEDIDFCKFY